MNSNRSRTASLGMLSQLGQLGLLGLAALSIAIAQPARADTLEAASRPQASDPTPYVKDNGEVLIMVCRRGVEPQDLRPMQEMPQDLPLLCLAAPGSEEALQMGPARFNQLLETAAGAGSMLVVLMPR